MRTEPGKKEVAALALAGTAALGGEVMDNAPKPHRRNHTKTYTIKKRKRQAAKESRRRNR